MMTTPLAYQSTAPQPVLETELSTRSMGGRLRVLVASATTEGDAAENDLLRAAGRIDAWARRLTRFDPTSDLGVLNAEPSRSPAPLRPTIAAALTHARHMAVATEGTVDVTLLDERIAAEAGRRAPVGKPSAWSLSGAGRRVELVRDDAVRFDLDGVAKGWLADRALGLLDDYPCALVDADGDVAVRASWSAGWSIAIADPHDDRLELARLRVPDGWPLARFGVATSGTSVHRWPGSDGPRHHLIDPRTGRPARTDVVQATVVAESTGLAEALAKSAVIRGSNDGLELLGRAGAWAALLLLEDGDLRVTPGTTRWLA